jgi:hypothetical protein
MKKYIAVEKLQFKSEAAKEYHKQKVSTAPCNHLKEIDTVRLIDGLTDNISEHYLCSICKHEMSIEDMEIREKTLEKFKKIKQ